MSCRSKAGQVITGRPPSTRRRKELGVATSVVIVEQCRERPGSVPPRPGNDVEHERLRGSPRGRRRETIAGATDDANVAKSFALSLKISLARMGLRSSAEFALPADVDATVMPGAGDDYRGRSGERIIAVASRGLSRPRAVIRSFSAVRALILAFMCSFAYSCKRGSPSLTLDAATLSWASNLISVSTISLTCRSV